MIHEPTGWSVDCDAPECGNAWSGDGWEPDSTMELLHDLRVNDRWIVLGRDGFYTFCTLDCLMRYRASAFRRHVMSRWVAMSPRRGARRGAPA